MEMESKNQEEQPKWGCFFVKRKEQENGIFENEFLFGGVLLEELHEKERELTELRNKLQNGDTCQLVTTQYRQSPTSGITFDPYYGIAMMKSNDKVSITKGNSDRNNKQIEITFHVDCDVIEETVLVTPYNNVNSTGSTPRCTASSYTKEQTQNKLYIRYLHARFMRNNLYIYLRRMNDEKL